MIVIDRLVWNNGLSDYQDMWMEWGSYRGGGLALELSGAEGPIARVTINLAPYDLHPDLWCFFIKNYSECEGLGEALVNAGVVERTGRKTVEFGPFGTTADEYRLTDQAKDDLYENPSL